MRPGTTDVPTAWRGLEDWLAKTLNENFRDQARTIVEVGVDWGYSLWWWQSIFPFAKIYGIDPYGVRAEGWAGKNGDDAFKHVKGWVDQQPRVQLIKQPSIVAASRWDKGPIDLVHIDGAHDYDSVKEDFEAWVPLLGKQRCVAFHDTISHHRTVGRFVMELEQRRDLGKFIYKTTQHYGMWVWQEGV